jgi:predicted DNA-binding transcriptional regulator AlpA
MELTSQAIEPIPAGSMPLLIDRVEVARLIHCSPRHVDRLSRRNAMPPPLKLGALTRWSKSTIELWIESGCPRVGTTGEKGATNAA